MDEDKRWIFAREQTEGTSMADDTAYLLSSLMGTDEVTQLPDGSYQHRFTMPELPPNNAFHALGRYLENIAPDVRRTVDQLHALFFPEQHKRLMLREAHRRARLITQKHQNKQSKSYSK